MSTTVLLYIWVKLDDIINVMANDYGWSVIIALIVICSIAATSASTADSDGDYYPFSGFFNKEKPEEKEKVIIAARRKVRVLICVVMFQLFLNVTATLLPSSKQLAVMYLVSSGVNSETFQALRSLDSDFAEYLKSQTKEWLHGQVEGVAENGKKEGSTSK